MTEETEVVRKKERRQEEERQTGRKVNRDTDKYTAMEKE